MQHLMFEVLIRGTQCDGGGGQIGWRLAVRACHPEERSDEGSLSLSRALVSDIRGPRSHAETLRHRGPLGSLDGR